MRLASQHPFWSALVAPSRPLLGGILLTPRGRALGEKDSDLFGPLLTRVRAYARDSGHEPADRLVDVAVLESLEGDELSTEQCRVLRRSLRALTLPAGGGHGDFSAQNMVLLDGAVSLIDWDCFRIHASVALDLVHFAVCALSREQGCSWTTLLTRRDLWQTSVSAAAPGTPLSPLMAAYAVNRVALETAQDGRLSGPGSRRRRKFASACASAAALLADA